MAGVSYNIECIDSRVKNIHNSENIKFLIASWNEIKEQIAKSNNNIIAIDAPLLLEANLQEICDKTIAVISEDRNLQIKRIIKRDNIDKEHAIARLNAQHPNEFYIQNCDNTLINDETLEQQIEKLLFSEN